MKSLPRTYKFFNFREVLQVVPFFSQSTLQIDIPGIPCRKYIQNFFAIFFHFCLLLYIHTNTRPFSKAITLYYRHPKFKFKFYFLFIPPEVIQFLPVVWFMLFCRNLKSKIKCNFLTKKLNFLWRNSGSVWENRTFCKKESEREKKTQKWNENGG